MNTEDIVRRAIVSLNEHNVAYMIVGSLATNYYSAPRSTQDADIVVAGRLTTIARRLRESQDDFQFDPQLGFESVTATQKLLIQPTTSDFQIELFALSDDEHDKQRFERRLRVELLENPAWIATLEDMIVTKLRWAHHAGREKDALDVRNLLAVQRENVDWSYVDPWCDEHGTKELLNQLSHDVGLPPR